ncbi:MAG: electron transfer flavoprotein subunit beta/FixA family protein [Geosporobacter ferrireducens]|nr:electron transfer flavoprotein subunit beta/FixA family protein [Geosporobacter ferrireducens]
MMNIIVCFKVVPDLDMLSYSDWVVDNHYKIDTSFVKNMINPYDESALELILKFKDLVQNEKIALALTALTIGDSRSNRVLKNLFALKYDKAVRVDCEADIRFNVPFITEIIARYLENNEKQQIIVLGSQSGEGDNGRTPFLLAERLGIPCVSGVVNIEPTGEEDYLKITSDTEDVIMEQVLRTPLILAVGNVQNSYMRVPTLKEKMASKDKEVETIYLEDLGIEKASIETENDLELVDLYYEKEERVCHFITGHSAADKAQVLFKKYLKEKLNL